MLDKKANGICIFLFFLAFGLRLLAAYSLSPVRMSPDAREYDYLGKSIQQRGTYGFAADWREDRVLAVSPWRFLYDEAGTVRPPGFPMVLALARECSGRFAPHFLIMTKVVMCGITAVLLFRIGMSVFGFGAGLVAGLLYAFSPTSTYAFLCEGRELFLEFFVVAPVYLTLKGVRDCKTTPLILAGVCVGVGAYFKENIAVLGAVAALWAFLFADGRVRAMRIAALSLLVCTGVIMVPWMVRNSLIYHHSTGMSTISGAALWMGLANEKWADDFAIEAGWAAGIPEEQRPRLDPFKAENAADADKRLWQIVRIYAVQNPGAVCVAALRNLGQFWSPLSRTVLTEGFRHRPMEIVSGLFVAGLEVLALAAVWIYRKKPATWLFVLILAIITITHIPFCSHPRYRAPYDSLLVVLAAAAATSWLCRRSLLDRNSEPIGENG